MSLPFIKEELLSLTRGAMARNPAKGKILEVTSRFKHI
jgi:hypothetical protein